MMCKFTRRLHCNLVILTFQDCLPLNCSTLALHITQGSSAPLFKLKASLAVVFQFTTLNPSTNYTHIPSLSAISAQHPFLSNSSETQARPRPNYAVQRD